MGVAGSTERQRKDGGLRQMLREPQTKERAMRIVITHQEEFMRQSAATWEQLLERRKEQLHQSPETRGDLPRPG